VYGAGNEGEALNPERESSMKVSIINMKFVYRQGYFRVVYKPSDVS
jgi:hypothetical protein